MTKRKGEGKRSSVHSSNDHSGLFWARLKQGARNYMQISIAGRQGQMRGSLSAALTGSRAGSGAAATCTIACLGGWLANGSFAPTLPLNDLYESGWVHRYSCGSRSVTSSLNYLCPFIKGLLAVFPWDSSSLLHFLLQHFRPQRLFGSGAMHLPILLLLAVDSAPLASPSPYNLCNQLVDSHERTCRDLAANRIYAAFYRRKH